MFDSIGWGEVLVIALAALFIFGPERLPGLAKDAAAGLKKVREALTGVREQMNESLGDDFAELRDLDVRKYHPRTFIRDQLFGDDDPLAGLGNGTGSLGLGATGAVRPCGSRRTRGTAASALLRWLRRERRTPSASSPTRRGCSSSRPPPGSTTTYVLSPSPGRARRVAVAPPTTRRPARTSRADRGRRA